MKKRDRNHSDAGKKKALKAIDFFCGAGGMSYGMSRAGIDVLAGIDIDSTCEATYTHNNKSSKFINCDISTLKCRDLADKLSVKQNDDNLILVGCSPCQFWSKVNTDRTKSKASAFLLKEFERFVDWFKPGFIVIENVPGLLTKKTHNVLPQFHNFLGSNNYAYDHDIINSSLYGVPQNRLRYLLVASRLTETVTLPKGRKNKRLVVRNFLGPDNGFPPIEAGHQGTPHRMHTASFLSPENLKRMSVTTPDGGTRACWKDDPDLQIDAYKGKDQIFKDVYGRMFWDQPAPTITTRFNSLSNGRFGHPEENRAISFREGATLQTFPKSYKFQASSQAIVARQIGNAVPPALALRIGKHLIKVSSNG